VLHKDGTPLVDLEDWRVRAGPKSDAQWSDFRSAKEAAKHWLGAFPAIPSDITVALKSHADFGEVLEWKAEPEVQLRFDKRRGEPRNTDLLLRGRDAAGAFVVAVEAKADESFDQTIAGVLEDALERLAANSSSGGVARVADLVSSLLSAAPKGSPSVAQLRYQLFTAAAGALAYAEAHGISRAVLFIQEFVTPKTTDEKHQQNADDLNRWLLRVSAGAHASLPDRQLLGPIAVPAAPLLTGKAALYVGKAQIRLR